jgi:hypothetical protein
MREVEDAIFSPHIDVQLLMGKATHRALYLMQPQACGGRMILPGFMPVGGIGGWVLGD